MNFKKIRGRIVITAGVLAMTVVPQAVSAACVQTQNAGEIRQPAYLAACLSDEGSVCSDFGKNRSCGGSSFCLTSDGWMNNGDSERCGFRYLFWGCNSDGENGDGGICFKPDIFYSGVFFAGLSNNFFRIVSGTVVCNNHFPVIKSLSLNRPNCF